MRLIDADALLKHLHKDPLYPLIEKYNIDGVIDNAPTIDAEPVKHGEWISHEGYDECSLCHVLTTYGSHYCPNCGAKMDGGYDEK